MPVVKVSTPFPDWPFSRQTPGQNGKWADYQFLIDKAVERPDFWVVCDDIGQSETTFCAPQNTILLTLEPPSVRSYSPRFLRQFSLVVSCHQNLKHPRVLHQQQALPWHLAVYPACNARFPLGYDDFQTAAAPVKTRLLSVICSDKSFSQGHRKRLEFVRQLGEYFKQEIDFYGRGIRDISDKWEAIAAYKYHIAIENSCVPHYWTEKISDAFLGDCHPFYIGAPNIGAYFPAESLTLLDYENPARAARQISDTIARNTFEETARARGQARELILNRYNFFPTIVEICQQLDAKAAKTELSLQPSGSFKRDPLSVLRRQFSQTKS